MGWVDWVSVILFVPLLVALTILLVYLVIGMLGSNARRRKIAAQAAAEPEPTEATRPKRATRQVPGD